MASYGFRFQAEARKKTVDSDIQSAFVKGNTREHILICYADDRLARPHLRTFMARTQARAFPELYPYVLTLVTPQDEAWAEAFEKKRKQEEFFHNFKIFI